MKPLIVLLGVFAISLLVLKLSKGSFDFTLSGCIAMSAMLVFTAMAHFVFNKGMAMMIPEFVPFKTEIVYITGVIEIAASVGLVYSPVRELTGWLLITFFLLILPANVYASLKQVDYQKATFDGNGITYLWFRVPLQLFYILWVYFAAIKK